MKIRNGFVSNSSTSSFIIYGVKLSEKEIQKLVTKHVGEIDFNSLKEEGIESGEYFSYETYHKELKKLGVDIENPICYEEPEEIESYGIYIGKSLGEMGSISDIPLEELINMRNKLKELFPSKKAKFYGEIVQS
jgi:hypothetical protein